MPSDWQGGWQASCKRSGIRPTHLFQVSHNIGRRVGLGKDFAKFDTEFANVRASAKFREICHYLSWILYEFLLHTTTLTTDGHTHSEQSLQRLCSVQ